MSRGCALFFLEFIAQLEDLDFNLALAIVLKNVFVRLTLAVPKKIGVLGVWRSGVARLEVGKIALNIARGTTTARGRESDVGRHYEDEYVRC